MTIKGCNCVCDRKINFRGHQMIPILRGFSNSAALFFVYVSLCGWFFIIPIPGGGPWDEREARDLVDKRDWTGLVEFSGKRLEAWPDHPIWLMRKGYALSNLGRHEEAAPVYKQITVLKPDNELAWNNLASAYNNLKKHADAVTAAQEAIRLKPQYARHWFNLAWAHYALGKGDKAKSEYEEVAKRDGALANEFRKRFPFDAVVLSPQAASPAKSPAQSSAVATSTVTVGDAQKSVALQPADPEAWVALADSYKAAKDYEKAVRAYREAIRLDGNYGSAMYRLGETYHLQGNREQVRDVYLALGRVDQELANKYFRTFILP